MQYTKLGNSDLTVSRICMGCMGFGDAAKAVELQLTEDAIAYLEEPYVPHLLSGVMAQTNAKTQGKRTYGQPAAKPY